MNRLSSITAVISGTAAAASSTSISVTRTATSAAVLTSKCSKASFAERSSKGSSSNNNNSGNDANSTSGARSGSSANRSSSSPLAAASAAIAQQHRNRHRSPVDEVIAPKSRNSRQQRYDEKPSSSGSSGGRTSSSSSNFAPIGFRRAITKHKQEESARYVKREQYTRIFEFLRGLRKSADAADNWEQSVAALKDAASRGTPMTSDLIAEAIESCYAAKQHATATDLYYRFHFDYNCERGAKASLAFLRVCAATGQFDAAKRVIEWIGTDAPVLWSPNADASATSSSSSSSQERLLESHENDVAKQSVAASSSSEKQSADAEEVEAAAAKEKERKMDDGTDETLNVHSLFGESSKGGAHHQQHQYVANVSFALTAEMLTLFLRSALTAAPNDPNLFNYHIYPNAIATYQNLRLAKRNARTVITNPLLVEALVMLHAKAGDWAKSYELLLKTVRLLSVDSSRGGGLELAGSDAAAEKGSGAIIPLTKSSRLRRLVQYGEDDAIAEGAAKDAAQLMAIGNNGENTSSSSLHEQLLSDGSLRGEIRMKESALDELLEKFGVKKKKEDISSATTTTATAPDAANKHIVPLNASTSIDAMLPDGGKGAEKAAKSSEYDDVAVAVAKAKEQLRQQQKEVAEFAEVERPPHRASSTTNDALVVKASTTSQSQSLPPPPPSSEKYTGPLPSNITYISQNTFDAVIRACFKAKRHLNAYKAAQLAVALGPAASNNFAPDESCARMLIFSIEEVTAQAYDLIAGNIVTLQFKREYLAFCKSERDKIREKIRKDKFNALLKQHNALVAQQKDGRLLSDSSSSSTPLSLLPPAPKLSDVNVSEIELLMALPDEIVASTTDLTARLNAYKLSHQLFKGLANNGFPLFPQTYESPFRTFIAAGQIDRAAEMIEEMRKDERIVPNYCYERLLCEKVAHERDTAVAKQYFRSLKAIADPKQNPAVLTSLLRHAANEGLNREAFAAMAAHGENSNAVGFKNGSSSSSSGFLASLPFFKQLASSSSLSQQQRFAHRHFQKLNLFRNVSDQMMRLSVLEDKNKMLLTIQYRVAKGDVMGAVGAYSRLNNFLEYEASRTQHETNYKVYPGDFTIPRGIMESLLELSSDYVAKQQVRKERLMLGRGGDGEEGEGGEEVDGGDASLISSSSSSSLVPKKKRYAEYWSAERDRNLQVARLVCSQLRDKLSKGIDGMYIGTASPSTYPLRSTGAAGAGAAATASASAANKSATTEQLKDEKRERNGAALLGAPRAAGSIKSNLSAASSVAGSFFASSSSSSSSSSASTPSSADVLEVIDAYDAEDIASQLYSEPSDKANNTANDTGSDGGKKTSKKNKPNDAPYSAASQNTKGHHQHQHQQKDKGNFPMRGNGLHVTKGGRLIADEVDGSSGGGGARRTRADLFSDDGQGTVREGDDESDAIFESGFDDKGERQSGKDGRRGGGGANMRNRW